jgi:ABC-type Fe3+ transport system permease subunit
MRTLTTVLVLVAIFGVLVVGAAVALAVELLPYVVLGIVIGAVIRSRRQQRSPVSRPSPPPPPQRQLPPGGWVYVPVWVIPPPPRSMPVIDAEFVRDPRGG